MPHPAFALLLTAIGFIAGWQVRDMSALRADTARARALTAAVEDARAIEHQLIAQLASIGEHHAEQHQTAPALETRLIDELRTGTVRLRDEWRRCETRRVSGVAAATAERDAAAADRDALAAALVRAGHDADAQLSACQAVIRAYVEATAP